MTTTAIEDQLDARTRDLLETLGLEFIASTSPEPEWIDGMSADDLLAHLMVNAALISERGRGWLLIGVRAPEGIAMHVVEVRKTG
jgi:hypothetical protein